MYKRQAHVIHLFYRWWVKLERAAVLQSSGSEFGCSCCGRYCTDLEAGAVDGISLMLFELGELLDSLFLILFCIISLLIVIVWVWKHKWPNKKYSSFYSKVGQCSAAQNTDAECTTDFCPISFTICNSFLCFSSIICFMNICYLIYNLGIRDGDGNWTVGVNEYCVKNWERYCHLWWLTSVYRHCHTAMSTCSLTAVIISFLFTVTDMCPL